MADDDEMPSWIERVVSVAGALGMNRVRVRWKLQRWTKHQLTLPSPMMQR